MQHKTKTAQTNLVLLKIMSNLMIANRQKRDQKLEMIHQRIVLSTACDQEVLSKNKNEKYSYFETPVQLKLNLKSCIHSI